MLNLGSTIPWAGGVGVGEEGAGLNKKEEVS